MDILEIEILKEKFDIIECVGVLHHMEKPLNGLQRLLKVLENDGFLLLGLYSKKARRTIQKAREYISSNNLKPNKKNIRNFRENIFSGALKEYSQLCKIADFYTISECRDLCFHEKEHQFTLNNIAYLLKIKNLEFLGFHIPSNIKSLYKNRFPEDKTQLNLKNWMKLENEYPELFLGMYQFWVSKTKI